jgi:hypothetical protein
MARPCAERTVLMLQVCAAENAKSCHGIWLLNNNTMTPNTAMAVVL